MTQDRNDPKRPLFADMDEKEAEATGTIPAGEPGKAAGVDPMQAAQPGEAAIPLGAPTSGNEPLDDDSDEPRS